MATTWVKAQFHRMLSACFKKCRCEALRKRAVVVGLTVCLATTPVKADDMREFMLSCTYGVLAGTLVGTAMLAFTEKPGDNLNKIARGASIGLYAGILLGAYLVYGVSSEEDPDGSIEMNSDGVPVEGGASEPEARLQQRYLPPQKFQVGVLPVVNPYQRMDGAVAVLQWRNF